MSLINKGGKKKRRGKNLNVNTRPMEYITEDQNYGLVLRVLGNGRFLVRCYPQNIDNIENSKELVCSVRGKMRRRIYVNLNDIVIVSLRDFQADKGDIIHKYTYDESNILKKKNLIPEIENSLEKTEVNFEEDSISESEDNIEYQNVNKNKKKVKKPSDEPYFNYDMLGSFNSDTDEDTDEDTKDI